MNLLKQFYEESVINKTGFIKPFESLTAQEKEFLEGTVGFSFWKASNSMKVFVYTLKKAFNICD